MSKISELVGKNIDLNKDRVELFKQLRNKIESHYIPELCNALIASELGAAFLKLDYNPADFDLQRSPNGQEFYVLVITNEGHIYEGYLTDGNILKRCTATSNYDIDELSDEGCLEIPHAIIGTIEKMNNDIEEKNGAARSLLAD